MQEASSFFSYPFVKQLSVKEIFCRAFCLTHFEICLLANFVAIINKPKPQSFAGGHFHVFERTLDIGNRNHFHSFIRRGQQIEITGVPDSRFEDKPNRFAGNYRGLEIVV